MVHLKVNKWSTCCLNILKTKVDHSLTQNSRFKKFLGFFWVKSNVPAVLLLLLLLLSLLLFRCLFLGVGGPVIDSGGGKCGPLIDPTPYIHIYIYIWLMTDLLPRFLALKTEYHPKIYKKKGQILGHEIAPRNFGLSS